MHRARLIENLDLPELAPYLTMRRMEEHRKEGLFVAEGDKVVHRLIRSHFGIQSLLVLPERSAEFQEALLIRNETVPVYVAAKHVLEDLTGYAMYQGVLAIGLVPPSAELAGLIAASMPAPLFAALEGIANSENVGALVRSAAAFGLDGLIVGETCCSPYLRRAVRNSMGGIFKLSVVESCNLMDSLRLLKSCGIQCVAAHPGARTKPLEEVDLKLGTCLVLGNEGGGLTEATLDLCDCHASIPMSNGIDSLNVAGAAAVGFYEADRQRRIAKAGDGRIHRNVNLNLIAHATASPENR